MRFRKKPIVIEAMQFTEESKNRCYHFAHCTTAASFEDGKPILMIQTLEGVMTTRLGDWIIKGVMGEFYPCKPGVFASTYEPMPHLVMVCGADCHPGDSVCNNYCNSAPQKGPMAKAPPAGPDSVK